MQRPRDSEDAPSDAAVAERPKRTRRATSKAPPDVGVIERPKRTRRATEKAASGPPPTPKPKRPPGRPKKQISNAAKDSTPAIGKLSLLSCSADCNLPGLLDTVPSQIVDGAHADPTAGNVQQVDHEQDVHMSIIPGKSISS